MSVPLIPTIEVDSVGRIDRLHKTRQIAVRRFHQKVKMIRHQAIQVQANLEIDGSQFQPLQEPNPILVNTKQQIPFTPPIPENPAAHMIYRPWKMNPQFSSHP
jgi:hypothetical protein